MASKPAMALALLPLILLALSPAAAHNITRILDQFPEFSAFNQFLNQTGVADQINSRTTITVLAVDNGAAGALSGQPQEVLEHILSVHVILDYYDAQKLHKLSKRSALVTTLFQSSGLASGRSGFLNVTDIADGQVAFGSGVLGAGLVANYVKEIATRPYNISVIQVSSIIYPPGINGLNPPPPPPPAPMKAVSPAPAKSVPAPAPAETDEPPAEPPEASAPVSPADAPVVDSPLSSPPSPTESDADAPAPDGAMKEHKSSAGRVAIGASIGVVMGVVLFGAL